MTIFWDSPIASISTPNFGPISMKLGLVVRFTKKMTLYKCGPGSGPNYGETAVCPLGREGFKWPKLQQHQKESGIPAGGAQGVGGE